MVYNISVYHYMLTTIIIYYLLYMNLSSYTRKYYLNLLIYTYESSFGYLSSNIIFLKCYICVYVEVLSYHA